jgi:hypothetical protein
MVPVSFHQNEVGQRLSGTTPYYTKRLHNVVPFGPDSIDNIILTCPFCVLAGTSGTSGTTRR